MRFHDNGHTGSPDPLPSFRLFIHWQADVQLVLYAHSMDGTFGEIQEEKVKSLAWKWLFLSLLVLLLLISNSAPSDNCTMVGVHASTTTRTTAEQKQPRADS